MVILQDVSYAHPNKDLLFSHLNMSLQPQAKAALVGNNGTGKSSLLKLMAGILKPTAGNITCSAKPFYVPQLSGVKPPMTVAMALQAHQKIDALKNILAGNASEKNMDLLDNDWTIEEKCQEALAHWGLFNINLTQNMETLSGGQQTRVLLAGINVHQPKIVLMDEPGNHLDTAGRKLLHNHIQNTNSTLLVVSHDEALLHLFNTVYELDHKRIHVYGGNYGFYLDKKHEQQQALEHKINEQEKALRKARDTQREALEHQQKLDARGKQKQQKAGVARIMMNTLRNKAENSTAKYKEVHAGKINELGKGLQELRNQKAFNGELRFDFDEAGLHHGKLMARMAGVNFGHTATLLWARPVNFTLLHGERAAVNGANGTGKSTWIKLLLGHLQPVSGTVERFFTKAVYVDQDYSLLNNSLTVYEQAQAFNTGRLEEHEIKTRLNRFLFDATYWQRPCTVLSGGEKMRLLLCCLNIGQKAPELMVLDEPTNNLDAQSIGILAAAVKDYKGTLLVVSHDEAFLKAIDVHKTIEL